QRPDRTDRRQGAARVVEDRARGDPGADRSRDRAVLLEDAVTDCARCSTPLEHGDLRCAVCALALPPADHVDAPLRAQVLRCTDCGAAVAFSAEAQAPRCAFCDAVMTVEHPIDPVEAAELRVPFAVDRDRAEASLRGWLAKRGYFAPAALSS